MTIRHIQKSDNAAIAAVIRSVLIEHNAPKTGSALEDEILDTLFEFYQAKNTLYFVVADGEKVYGGGGIAPLANGPEEVCELQKLYFLPEIRGKGFAKAIVENCLAFAKDCGFTSCYLKTLPNMDAAQKRYLNMGFEHIDAPMGNTGHSNCPVWMLKEL